MLLCLLTQSYSHGIATIMSFMKKLMDGLPYVRSSQDLNPGSVVWLLCPAVCLRVMLTVPKLQHHSAQLTTSPVLPLSP